MFRYFWHALYFKSRVKCRKTSCDRYCGTMELTFSTDLGKTVNYCYHQLNAIMTQLISDFKGTCQNVNLMKNYQSCK